MHADPQRYFSGSLAHLALFDAALSAPQASALFNSYTAPGALHPSACNLDHILVLVVAIAPVAICNTAKCSWPCMLGSVPLLPHQHHLELGCHLALSCLLCQPWCLVGVTVIQACSDGSIRTILMAGAPRLSVLIHWNIAVRQGRDPPALVTCGRITLEIAVWYSSWAQWKLLSGLKADNFNAETQPLATDANARKGVVGVARRGRWCTSRRLRCLSLHMQGVDSGRIHPPAISQPSLAAGRMP